MTQRDAVVSFLIENGLGEKEAETIRKEYFSPTDMSSDDLVLDTLKKMHEHFNDPNLHLFACKGGSRLHCFEDYVEAACNGGVKGIKIKEETYLLKYQQSVDNMANSAIEVETPYDSLLEQLTSQK